MGFRRTLATAIVGMLILTGCSAGPAVDDQPTPTPVTAPVPPVDNGTPGEKQVSDTPVPGLSRFTDAQGLPFPVPSTEANPILSVNRHSAWGSNLDIIEIPTVIEDGYIFMLRAVTEDGRTIVGRALPDDKTSFAPPKLVLMDVASRQVTEIETGPDDSSSRYSWANGVTIDGEWVVWQEGRTLQLYNIGTQARSEINLGNEVYDAHMRIKEIVSLDHSVMVWAEATSDEPAQGKISSVVKSMDLATGKVSVLGRHGVNPTISWPTVIWIEPDLTTEQEGQLLGRFVTLDMETGVTRVLSDLHGAIEVAAYGDKLAWRGWFSGIGVVYLSNLTETQRQIIAPEGYGERQNVTMNERIVVWDSTVGDVWDRELGRLVRLSETRGVTTARLNDKTLAWQAVPGYNQQMGYGPDTLQPEDMKIYLLDTSQLGK